MRIEQSVVFLGDFKVHNVDYQNLGLIFRELMNRPTGAIITYANAHTFCLSKQIPELMDLNRKSDLVLVDGYGMIWAGRTLKRPLSYKLALTNLDLLISECAVEADVGIYFLGAKEGVATLAANKLQAKYPELKIAGTHHGYFDKTDSKIVLDGIRASGAKVLVVGFGSPIQDRWYLANQNELENIVCILGGQCLEYWAGLEPRPPAFMSRYGLAWLYRTVRHPRRMIPRYIRVIPEFIVRILHLRYKMNRWDSGRGQPSI